MILFFINDFTACINPLGVSSLPNVSFNASSSLSDHDPWHAKFVSAQNESWCPLTTSSDEYLEIDLGDTYVIGAIATEGDVVKNCWTSSFSLEYKKSVNDSWQSYAKQGQHEAVKVCNKRSYVVCARVLCNNVINISQY
jgi:hypothetical protein